MNLQGCGKCEKFHTLKRDPKYTTLTLEYAIIEGYDGVEQYADNL